MTQIPLFPAPVDEPLTFAERHRDADEPIACEPIAAPSGAFVRETYRQRKSNLERIREILSNGEWHSANDLDRECGRGYRNRLNDLRNAGEVIHRKMIAASTWAFRLDASKTVIDGCNCRACLCREAGSEARP